MKTMRTIGWLWVALLLASCGGGGGGAGANVFGGGSTTSVSTAADLLLTLDKASVSNSGADAVNVTVTAVDGSRVAVASAPITLSVNNNAFVATLSGATTDTNGKVTGAVQTGTDRSNRIITVTASSGSIKKTASFSVVGAKIIATVLQPIIAPGASGRIQYRLTDVTDQPMVGVAIDVSAAGIASSSGVTVANGIYEFNYVAPASAGQLSISATAGGVTSVQTVVVQSGGTIPPVTAVIAAKSLSANPSVVSVNSGTSSNRADIRALFLGLNNAPIANVRVKFDLNGDVNSVGGTVGTDVVYSDANGVATTTYVPGSRSSPTDGVTIRACYYVNDAAVAVGACATSVSTTLTVVNETVAVSIGTDNTIADGAAGLAYVKKFAVLVVDAAGQAKSNVQITPSIDLTEYLRGFYVTPNAWTRTASNAYVSPPCANEDVNRNGQLDAGEDVNHNSQLDPRKSDVTVSMVGSNLTDSTGVATLQILYPKSVATWVNFRILVSASGVSGTEGRAVWVGQLPAAAAEFQATNPPSFAVSPYGQGRISDGNGGFITFDCSTRDPTASNQP